MAREVPAEGLSSLWGWTKERWELIPTQLRSLWDGWWLIGTRGQQTRLPQQPMIVSDLQGVCFGGFNAGKLVSVDKPS